MPWEWGENTQRYRDTVTGLFLSASAIREESSNQIRASGSVTDSLAAMLTNDRLNGRDWEILMREEIKDEYIMQYLEGRGGVSQMTPQDWGSIGGMLADQYRFLGPFAREIAAGQLSEAQIAQRSRMYINSAMEAASRANARAQGWPPLPSYRADGSTECLTNDRCFWTGFQRPDGDWEFTWNLDFEAEHCTSDEIDAQGRPRGCIERAALWDPLVIEAA